MKKLSSLTALAALVAVGATAEPVVYGKANLTAQNSDEAGESTIEVKSNASRLGVKGSHAIEGSSLEAIYKMEFQVSMDEGKDGKSGNTITQRNVYLGVKGDFGTARIGKFDTPLKVAQNKVDLFNDLEGDIKNVITASDKRPSNIIGYTTPKALWGASIAYVAAEETGEDSAEDGVSASLKAGNEMFYVAVAYDKNIAAQELEVIRGVAQLNFADAWQIGALVEQNKMKNADDVDGWMLSGQFAPNKWAFKAQVGQSDINLQDVANAKDGETYSIGADYNMSKNFKWFGFYTENKYSVSTNTVDAKYLALGAQLKF